MTTSARLYNCARCHGQVIICRDCDRGNVYCGPACAVAARRESRRRAAAKYQASRRGRFSNADRQRRYRQRQRQKVTHQGSPPTSPNDLLARALSQRQRALIVDVWPQTATVHCHRCHRPCGPLLRRGFIRSPARSPQLSDP